MTAFLRPPDWTRQAACDGHPLGPRAWDGNGTPAARAVCATCPVRLACVIDALEDAIPDTLRGGLDPDDRRTIADRFGYDRPGAARHGDRSRYTAGCRCPHCREAHRRWAVQRRATGAWTSPATDDHRMTA